MLKTRSACACLIGAVFGSAAWQGIVFFGTSFYRSSFELPSLMAAYLLAILAVFFSIGSVLRPLPLWSGIMSLKCFLYSGISG